MIHEYAYSKEGVGEWTVHLAKSAGKAMPAATQKTTNGIAECEGSNVG